MIKQEMKNLQIQNNISCLLQNTTFVAPFHKTNSR